MTSCPTVEPPAGPSIEKSASRIDHVFNFQIVVFEVENTLFQVLRNGFNVPGTPFEAMFALPQTQTDNDSIEGSSFENPIRLPGIKVDHFRSFLRVLYPFIDQTPVVGFDEWVGVLNLATMWLFQEIREKAVSKLSNFINQKTVMERLVLAKEYRVAEWRREAYLELTREALWPDEPYSNWEADAEKWGAKDWETLARVFYLQAKVAASIAGRRIHSYRRCNTNCDASRRPDDLPYSESALCRCYLLPMVDEAFQGELESLAENPGHLEHPLPSDDTDSAALPKASGGSKKKKRKVEGC